MSRRSATRSRLNGGKQPTGEDVKKGFEQIHDLTLGGLVPPLKITPEDHEGGGWVQIFTVKGGKFVKEATGSAPIPRSSNRSRRIKRALMVSTRRPHP